MELDREELHQNYKDLHETTGESWDSIIARVEGIGDKKLAAELRERAAGGEKKAPPQERRSTAKKPVTASGGDK